jgi:hypothetical protein
MIRERQIKGPIDTIEHDGKNYPVEYRRRYYETATHFTWIEIEVIPGAWIESDAIQTGLKRLTKNIVRAIAKETIENHFSR